jgi:hypothetical protein
VFLDKFLYFFSVFRHKNLFTDVTQNAGNIATANPRGSFPKESFGSEKHHFVIGRKLCASSKDPLGRPACQSTLYVRRAGISLWSKTPYGSTDP